MARRIIRVKVPLSHARTAITTLRGVKGFVYKREDDGYAVHLEPGDPSTTAKLVYQLEALGIDVDTGALPEAVVTAYDKMLREDPQLLVESEAVDDDAEVYDFKPTRDDDPRVAGALVEYYAPRAGEN